jgi:hypothetical protein
MAVAKEGYSIEFTYNSMMLFAFEDHVFVARRRRFLPRYSFD